MRHRGIRPLAMAGPLALARTLAMAGLAMLAACSSPPIDGPGEPVPMAWPAGRTFVSVSVSDDGQRKVLVAGTRISIFFSSSGDRRLAVSAGCNSLSVPASTATGVLQVTGDVITTLMGCSADLEAQDAWVAELITGSPRVYLEGDRLWLTGEHDILVLVDQATVGPDRSLTETSWVVDTLLDAGVAAPVSAGAPAVLVVDPGTPTTFDVRTGCAGGELAGYATVADGTITLRVEEESPCTDGGNALDEAVRSVLSGPVTYQLSGARLTLAAADGSGLGLRAGE